jgi:single-strand DNA-binding protein
MSANFNNTTLVGNLTKDPELRFTNSGTAVVNFSLAVNNPARDDEVLFINCVAFAKLAEVIDKYTEKGKNILINGRLVLDSYETNEGEKRSQIKLFTQSMQLLGSSTGATTDTAESADDVEEYDI